MMPKWRKLWTKATESLDIHEMPDDTTRLAWLLLPLVLDREGRALDNPAWLKAKLFPLRMDLGPAALAAMLDWWEAHGMIERYQVGGRSFFWVPSFATYQGDTSREAESQFPEPPSQVETNSGVSRERVQSGSCSDADADADTDQDADVDADQAATVLAAAAFGPVAQLLTGFGVTWRPEYSREFAGLSPPVVEAWIRHIEKRKPQPHNPQGLLITCLRSGRAPPGGPLSIREQERRHLAALVRSSERWGATTGDEPVPQPPTAQVLQRS